MASFFKRLFSSNYRRATAAEAEGHLDEAARLYAEAGERNNVCRIHRLRARAERDLWKRIELLRLAQEHSRHDDVEKSERYASCRELAEALVAWVDGAGVTDRQDRSYLEEAAQLFVDVGEFELGGDLYERIGFFNKATVAYTEAGAVFKLDMLLDREDQELGAQRKERSLLDEFRFAENQGQYLEAMKALEQAIEANPDDPSLRDLHQRFVRRIPKRSRIHLKVEGRGGSIVFIGTPTLTMGRDEAADMPLRAPGVSRLHAQLIREDKALLVEDLDSKNGTFVDDEVAAPTRALSQEGSIALGDRCRLDYHVLDNGCVALRPAVARARNTLFVWGASWTSGVPESPLPRGLSFRCREGYWHLICPPGATLDEKPFSGEVLLRSETTVAIETLSFRIDS